MSWETLDIHIENLIPGIVLLTILIVGWPVPLGGLSGHEGLLVTAFVGTAYMLGAVGNVLARLLLDFVCRKTIRAYFMRLFIGDRLELNDLSSSAISKRYSAVITAGLSCGNSRVEAEVAKRRQTGRVLRSTLVPAVLAILAVGKPLSWSPARNCITVILCYVILLLLYAYAEVVVFQEGYRGEQTKKSGEKPPNQPAETLAV